MTIQLETINRPADIQSGPSDGFSIAAASFLGAALILQALPLFFLVFEGSSDPDGIFMLHVFYQVGAAPLILIAIAFCAAFHIRNRRPNRIQWALTFATPGFMILPAWTILDEFLGF